jgi:hypothetical protein
VARGLSQLINRNFVSEGTNFTTAVGGNTSREYPDPQLDASRCGPPEQITTVDALGNSISGRMIFCANSFTDPNTGVLETNPRMTTFSLLNKDLQTRQQRVAGGGEFTLNALNAVSTGQLTIPRAVGYSAGLLNYFFRGRLAVFRAPGPAPGGGIFLQIRNLTDEPMKGRVSLYWDDTQGTRAPVPGAAYDVDLQPKGSTDGPGRRTDTTDSLPFNPVPAAQGRYTAVFQGTLGAEEGAVIGLLLRPQVVFVAPFANAREVVRMDADDPTGATARRLTTTPPGEVACRDFPALSPDGRRLAYFLSCGPQATGPDLRLIVKDLDTGEERDLGPFNMGAAWSPDGTEIVSALGTGGPSARDLTTITVATGAQRRITALNTPDNPDADFVFGFAAWAPDGRLLVTTLQGLTDCQGQGSTPALVAVEAATGAFTVLDCGVAPAAPVAWAPDGNAVLYSRPELVTPVTAPPRYQEELFRLGLLDGTRTRLTFTATLNPAGQPVDEVPGGFVGTARVLFRSKLGAPATSELFNVTLDGAGGYGLANRIGTDLPRLLEAPPLGPFFTADPNLWQPLP